MLYPSLYEELDIERYAIMAKDMLPSSNVAIALCDDSAQIVWMNSDDDNLKTLFANYREWESTLVTNTNCECTKAPARQRQHRLLFTRRVSRAFGRRAGVL